MLQSKTKWLLAGSYGGADGSWRLAGRSARAEQKRAHGAVVGTCQ